MLRELFRHALEGVKAWATDTFMPKFSVRGSLADPSVEGSVNEGIPTTNAVKQYVDGRLTDELYGGVDEVDDYEVNETPLYVDLGLPSGNLWATKNVGAERPEDVGDYYAWGADAPFYSGSGIAAEPSWKEGCETGYSERTYENKGLGRIVKVLRKWYKDPDDTTSGSGGYLREDVPMGNEYVRVWGYNNPDKEPSSNDRAIVYRVSEEYYPYLVEGAAYIWPVDDQAQGIHDYYDSSHFYAHFQVWTEPDSNEQSAYLTSAGRFAMAPRLNDFRELFKKTNVKFEKRIVDRGAMTDEVWGLACYSENNPALSIFFPVTGYRDGTNLLGTYGDADHAGDGDLSYSGEVRLWTPVADVGKTAMAFVFSINGGSTNISTSESPGTPNTISVVMYEPQESIFPTLRHLGLPLRTMIPGNMRDNTNDYLVLDGKNAYDTVVSSIALSTIRNGSRRVTQNRLFNDASVRALFGFSADDFKRLMSGRRRRVVFADGAILTVTAASGSIHYCTASVRRHVSG